ncbi:MerR family transcriptional regulator [Sulfitobacter sp.]|jgi:DNA-binding transcriptional MerR regulator|uniref:MerR family transcriptional regulator n=1 Tax=Sulfitobacter TaxID=60136 RepID=UPI00341A97FC
MLLIGQLPKRTRVKTPPIRDYEQMGLIDAPEPSEVNQRRYTKEGLSRLSLYRSFPRSGVFGRGYQRAFKVEPAS